MAGKQLMEQPLSSPAERSRASQFNGWHGLSENRVSENPMDYHQFN
jgi:hypothetical protein